jgi:uncharacterized protein (TIGR00375 family)
MNLETMEKAALQKGIDVLSLSDFTHPEWFKEISAKLIEAESGIYQLKDSPKERRASFVTSTEIACIYTQNGKLRRIHLIVCLSSLEKAARLNHELFKRGAKLHADGRPILGMSAKALLELCLEIDDTAMMIPAHIWTPHFGVYGSASGFDSLEECFEDLAPYIYGIETGISSDPEMNWQISELETRSILSFSDAQSLPKMAREATVLVADRTKPIGDSFNYEDIRAAIMKKPGTFSIHSTIEFYPEEGKYHFSGHRKCKISYSLEDVLTKGTTCPVCGRKLTEGVYIRLQQLAPNYDAYRVGKETDENGMVWYTDTKKMNPPYVKLVPLKEIIAESFGVGVGSKKVESMFELMIEKIGTELDILMEKSLDEITQVTGEKIAEGVSKNRKGQLSIVPGFDGEYGKVTLWEESEKNTPQLPLGF